MADVLTFTERGIYCPAGDFYIDPWRPVDRALITHGHSDHARPGMGRYLATTGTAPVMRHRLGNITLETIRYGEKRRIGDATVSFHPAGHVPGSAQIRVAVKGQVWVVSGDYKTVADGLSEAFEPVTCHAFITECTFGLPIFKWTPEDILTAQINDWWAANAAAGKASILGAYALGKAQRLLTTVNPDIGPILTHGAIENTSEVLRAQGIDLPDTAFASGWMTLRGVRRRRAADRGFIVSDHADWDGLNAAIKATGATKIFATHGYTSVFERWLRDQGYDAHTVSTDYHGEALDSADEDSA